tara:strand:+ start:245 stop:580 length:336 start_codon:yes stop_codon:yes gene_type:complete
VNKTDSRLKARDQRIKDLDVIINIQEQVIKTQKSNLDIEKKSYNQQIKDLDMVLVRTYKGHGVLMNKMLYFQDMAEHFYKRFCLEITNNTMKGKKKNVEKKRKTKRKTRTK